MNIANCFFATINSSLTMWWTNKGIQPLNPPLTQKDGVCVQRYLGGDISLVAFEPSDLIGEW
jgi:hypothetical protein